MVQNMTLQEKIGQRLFINVEGKELTEEMKRLIREYKIGNVVLFQPNIDNIPQLKKFCDDLRAYILQETGHPAFLAVDQEGGGVTRLSEDCVNVPGAMALAAIGRPENAHDAALLTAKELRAFGINFDFAPVADVCNNPQNPVIGIRSFGDTPELVTEYALQALKGYEEGRVASCAKHFPGHGDTGMDSHISLPCIDKSLEELRRFEFVPFKALIDAGCPAVMTAHILFPQIEKEQLPATMSRTFMTDILRGELGFSGLCLSDSLEMDAIKRFYGVSTGAVMSLKAGVDIILTGKGSDVIEEEILAIREAVEAGELSSEEMDVSVERILHYKSLYCLPPKGEAGLPEHQAQSDALRRQTITLVSGQLPSLGSNPLFAGPDDYRLTLVSNEVGNAKTFAEYMREQFGGDAFSTGKDPDADAAAEAASLVAGHSSVILNTYNAHVFTGQLRLVEAVLAECRRLGIPAVVTALRNPHDLSRISDCSAKLEAWDYSMMTLNILSDVFAGRLIPTGRLPISSESEVSE